MGTIVAAAAASHSPGITGFVDMADPGQVERFHGAMHEIGRRFEEADPDVIVTITNEHFVNFYLDNVPAICVGTATSYFGPVEPWLGVPQTDVPGERRFAKALVADALAADFDVSFSEELRFDHGTMVPLHFANPDMAIPVVPIVVNNLYPPLPRPGRLYDFGRFLARAIADDGTDTRVALLATGGLSHKVGTVDAGEITPDFDRSFLDDVVAGNGSKLAVLTSDELAEIGNGTHEVRNWLCVMGTLGDVGAEVLSYEEVPAWATGCAAVAWKL